MEMLTGNGYPSKHLKGEVGQHYKDLETGDIFECVSANKHSRINLHQTGGYIWKKVAHGEHVEVCGGGSGLPSGSAPSPHQMLVTNEDGQTEWQERPVYKATERINVNDLFGAAIYPNTFTTVANSGANIAEGLFEYEAVPGTAHEVVFDGVTYSCVVAENGGLGATFDGPAIDFSEYPFCFVEGGMVIATQTAGEHTIASVHFYEETVTGNYAPRLLVSTKKDSDGDRSLSPEDAAAIITAWNNGIPVFIKTAHNNLRITLSVSEVNDSFIIAHTVSAASYHGVLTVYQHQFKVSGEFYVGNCAKIGNITENGNNYPLLYIANRPYKITIDSDGTLKATLVE